MLNQKLAAVNRAGITLHAVEIQAVGEFGHIQLQRSFAGRLLSAYATNIPDKIRLGKIEFTRRFYPT